MGYNKKASREDVIRYLLMRTSYLTKTQLMKLSYFADLEHMKRYGTMLSEASYIRDKRGPVDYSIPDTAQSMDDVDCVSGSNFYGSPEYDFKRKESMVDSAKNLSSSAQSTLDWVIENYGQMSASRLSELTHSTEPWIASVNSGKSAVDLSICKNEKKKEYLDKIRASIDRSTIGTAEEIEVRNAKIRREMLRYKVVCQ
jgi:uncharacterized phage-associated protein